MNDDGERQTDGPKESLLRIALRHVQEGRARLRRQHELIEKLRLQGFPTEEAEGLLDYLRNTQGEFEEHYHKLLDDARQRLRLAGYKDPTEDWPRD